MKQKSDEFATKKDLQILREDLSKSFREDLENAVVHISSAIIKSLDEINQKIDDTRVELKEEIDNTRVELKEEIRDVKIATVDIKRRLTDLETDMPSEKTCKKHDLRLAKLEKSVFA